MKAPKGREGKSWMPARVEAWMQENLRLENWERLRPEGVVIAEREIRRRKWRGARKGVLPGGVDAEDIVDHVIEEMLSGNCRLVFGFTWEKVLAEMERLIRQGVRVLHRLKEAGATQSEWKAVASEEGEKELVSLFADVVSETPSADELLVSREEEEHRKDLLKRLENYLAPELRGVFRCLCEGIKDPKEIGRRLGMEEKAVIAARARLERRLAKIGKNGR